MRQFDGCCIIPGRLIPVMLSDKGGATKRGDARRSRNRGLLFSRENEKKKSEKKEEVELQKTKARGKNREHNNSQGRPSIRPSAFYNTSSTNRTSQVQLQRLHHPPTRNAHASVSTPVIPSYAPPAPPLPSPQPPPSTSASPALNRRAIFRKERKKLRCPKLHAAWRSRGGVGRG